MDFWETLACASSGQTPSESHHYETNPAHSVGERVKPLAFREKHLQLLKQLLHRALIEGRLGAAREIFKYLLQSSVFVANEPRLLLRVWGSDHRSLRDLPG